MPSVSKSESIDLDRIPQSGGSWLRNPATGELTPNPVADSVGSGSASEDPITQPDGASPGGTLKE